MMTEFWLYLEFKQKTLHTINHFCIHTFLFFVIETLSTPFHINKDGNQIMIDGDDQEFIAIGSIGTLYAILKNLEDCTSIRDIKICQNVTTILKKVGTSKPDCLLNLFIGNYEQAKVNNQNIYLYSSNSTLHS